MTSRERVLTTLRHQEPDCIPFDLGSTGSTGINADAYARLRRRLGLAERPVVLTDIKQNLALVEEDVLARLEVDTRGVQRRSGSSFHVRLSEDAGSYYYTDEWGITYRKPKAGGLYFDIVRSPLAEARTAADVERHHWPNPLDEARIEGVAAEAEQVARETDACIVVGCMFSGLLEMGCWLRGFEEFYLDLAMGSAVGEAILDKLTELKLAYWGALVPRLGENVDVVRQGDDYGQQQGLLISRETYRKYFFPRFQRIFAAMKKTAGKEVFTFFHCCGAIRELIPDLIESGVDILNPVQVNARGMDTKELKREFGRDLSFWGGGVDTQQVLPRGSEREVREEVRRRIDDLAPGGGFLFATVHNIQGDVSAGNIMAMWETYRSLRAYR
jgi:uroporphyrinogen decarboxylase